MPNIIFHKLQNEQTINANAEIVFGHNTLIIIMLIFIHHSTDET